MRRTGLLFAAAVPVLVQAAPALTQTRVIPDWTIETWTNRNDGQLETPPRDTYEGLSRSWNSVISPDDVPADLRRRRINTNTLVAIDVDATGRATSCRVARASTEARLDALVCSLLMTRGSFAPRRPGPGAAAPATWGLVVYWRVLDRAQIEERERRAIAAPMAPPPPVVRPGQVPYDRRWPRLDWYGGLRPVALPALQTFYPRRAGRPAEGVTSVDLIVDPATGGVGCEVGVSSGNATLDDQACLAARDMRFTYLRPCDLNCRPERLPLQFVWARRDSHIRTPLLTEYSRDAALIRDPADRREATRYRSYRRLLPPPPDSEAPPADRSHSNGFIALRYTIDAEGVVRNCTVAESSGNQALDGWFCRRILTRFRYAPRTDVFGTPVGEVETFRMNLNRPG